MIGGCVEGQCPVYTKTSSSVDCAVMYGDAADRLEFLQKKLDELTTENELLRGALASASLSYV